MLKTHLMKAFLTQLELISKLKQYKWITKILNYKFGIQLDKKDLEL